MKRIALLATLAALTAAAQTPPAPTPRTVTLNWADTRNPTSTTYTVYRATGLCSGAPTFSKLAAAIAEKTYQDQTVTPGNYCYQVTAVLNGMESAASNQATAAVTPWPPIQVSAQIQ